MEVDVAVPIYLEAEYAYRTLGPPQGCVQGVGALGTDSDGAVDVPAVVDGDLAPPGKSIRRKLDRPGSLVVASGGAQLFEDASPVAKP